MNILSLQYPWLRKSGSIQVHFPVSDLLRKFTGVGTQLRFITVKEYKAKSAKGKARAQSTGNGAQASKSHVPVQSQDTFNSSSTKL